ncbi:MAG: SDR family NAD(P)-dependent oxidoreductase [Myxococcales bacterium]|nr:SDR family NAD(P)-dependent oxidoreductase [Myxococcales bacterium]
MAETAFITGAASGIGAALAAALVARGAHVWLTDRDAERLGPTVEALRAVGGTVFGRSLDVTDADAFAAVVDEAWTRSGGLDLVFNNAGVGLAGEVRDLKAADWRPLFEVNVLGVANGITAAYPRMVAAGRGHLVNIASGAALAPRPGMAPYAASKAAVLSLSLSLRAEAALHGVRVSAVCPGYIATGIMDRTRFVGLDRAGLAAAIPVAPLTPEQCARITLRGVARNRAVIPVSRLVALEWRLARFAPWLVERVAGWRARQFAAHRSEPCAPLKDDVD